MRRQKEELVDQTLVSFTLDEEEENINWSASAHGSDSSDDSGGSSPAVVEHGATSATTDSAAGQSADTHMALSADILEQQLQQQTADKVQKARRTPDERREQNRLTVQRFYYRKKVGQRKPSDVNIGQVPDGV